MTALRHKKWVKHNRYSSLDRMREWRMTSLFYPITRTSTINTWFGFGYPTLKSVIISRWRSDRKMHGVIRQRHLIGISIFVLLAALWDRVNSGIVTVGLSWKYESLQRKKSPFCCTSALGQWSLFTLWDSQSIRILGQGGQTTAREPHPAPVGPFNPA